MQDTVIEGIDYGPLSSLVGVWQGNQGVDVAPEPDSDEVSPYYEVLTFEAAGDVTNAEEQTLSVVRYHQVVHRKSNDEVFHDQVGYWLWDSATGVICQTLTIPRAVTLLAGGTAQSSGETTVIEVKAVDGSDTWGIVQSPFMREKARTTEFQHKITVTGDTLVYSETTVLEIYGKAAYPHTDGNTLTRS
ncbi:DUF1794 domain-containing protein [Halieaceae bacterium IMCC14734]|uniref:DUF1794 domain-containing protein n=1 Tax=Candidatus Litorirhabdus singularis TaxID=2518993 RepID=A0ABT3TH26_9GAMM|nr:heme-binding beta-barrel domain-containing protein [Candidatus Litorirhabdus singularis]MCX2981110.1 DUF1794 domain-containing protein [Candidatus Litorirhabdus singularis]